MQRYLYRPFWVFFMGRLVLLGAVLMAMVCGGETIFGESIFEFCEGKVVGIVCDDGNPCTENG